MAIRVVRLGSPRTPGEGLRLGTVRRPPRGVPKAQYASRGFYDVWLPELAPSESLVKQALHASDELAWRAFAKRYRAERGRAPSRAPCRSVAPDQFLGGLLLCRRIALPPLGAEGVVAGIRGEDSAVEKEMRDCQPERCITPPA